MAFSRIARRDAMLLASTMAASQCFGGNSSKSEPTPPEADAMPNSERLMNRIVFAGNPWPNGHAIEELIWSGRLDPESGLWFDLHLKSARYNAEDGGVKQEEAKDGGDWKSKVVWSNYQRCTLSSTKWGHRGFLAATSREKLDFAKLGERIFKIDPLPPKEDYDRAFAIYLLGHDGAADHRIHIKSQGSANNYFLDWSGKIALEYTGSRVFKYTFHVQYDHLTFEGIRLPDGMTEKDAMVLLKTLVENLGELKAERKDDSLWLVPV